MWANLKKQFTRKRLGVSDAPLHMQPFMWILGLIAVVGGIQGAWGDKRPIGGFFEGAIASVLYIVPLLIFFVAIAFAEAAQETYQSRPITWLAGIAAFFVFGGIFYTVVDNIPGVGWRFRAMINSDCYVDWDGRSNPTVCE
jgi:hypothetical protein